MRRISIKKVKGVFYRLPLEFYCNNCCMQDPPANALFTSKSLRRDMIGTLIKYLPKYVLIVS